MEFWIDLAMALVVCAWSILCYRLGHSDGVAAEKSRSNFERLDAIIERLGEHR
jgi:hypothetical protein